MIRGDLVKLFEVVVELGEEYGGGFLRALRIMVVKSGDEGFGFGLVLAAEG